MRNSNAQRRIYEVNKRVKSLQSQYKKLLSSIKNVEKQMLETQVKNKSVAAKTATGNLRIKQVLFCKFSNLLSPFKKLCLANIRFRV